MRILRDLRYVANRILVYEMVLICIAIVISWVRGRLTVNSVATNWIYVGIGTIAFGLFSVYGAWGSTRSFTYQHSASVTRSIMERYEDHERDMGEAFGFFGQAFVVGFVAILGGTILSVLVGS